MAQLQFYSLKGEVTLQGRALKIGNSCQHIHGERIPKERGHWKWKIMVRLFMLEDILYLTLVEPSPKFVCDDFLDICVTQFNF